MATRASLRLVKKHYYDVVKPSKGYYNDEGTWVEGMPVVTSVEMNIQPVPGTSLVTLPDAFRSEQGILIFTTYPLRELLQADGGYRGDVISYDGYHFRVRKVLKYKMGVRDHFEVYALREDLLTTSAEYKSFELLEEARLYEDSVDELYAFANVEYAERLGLYEPV